MFFSELCEKYFGSTDLYEILNIPKEATQSDVRRAYYKLSLRCHPDRVVGGQEEAKEKFNVLGKIYEIMSDDNKRALYDNTGFYNEDDDNSTVFGDRDWTEYWHGLFKKVTMEELNLYEVKYRVTTTNSILGDRNWTEYWRGLFKTVTMEDLEEYEVKYRDSVEELEDLKTAYEETKGDIDKILDYIPFVMTMEDKARIRSRILDLIEKEKIPKYDIFVNEPQAKRDRRHRKVMPVADLPFAFFVEDLPPELVQQGWKKVWSKRENRPYFWNKLTGVSQWEMPTKKPQGMPVADLPFAFFVEDLPPELVQQGWKKVWSKRENRPYFWNKLTGVSQWEMPTKKPQRTYVVTVEEVVATKTRARSPLKRSWTSSLNEHYT